MNLVRILAVCVPVLLLGACATVDRQEDIEPPEAPAPPPGQIAPFTAARWVETDAVVTLANATLADQFRTTLEESLHSDDLAISAVRLDFSNREIAFEIDAQLKASEGIDRRVWLAGDIVLSYSGAGLSWFPRIHTAVPAVPDPEFDSEAFLARSNAQLVRNLVVQRGNGLGLRLTPPQTLTLGAALPGLQPRNNEKSFTLGGAFTVAASLVAVRESHTTIALDLEYVDGVAHCQSDFSISRSTFAGRVVNREPREISAQIPPNAPIWHYYTEVAGARRNLTLVHYWFADGRPVGVTELSVEPSERWRTWSSMPVKAGTARHIEVFSADRDTGCIVDAAHIELAGERDPQASELFDRATQGFSGTDQTQLTSIEISRIALAEALNSALDDARFSLRFDLGEGEERTLDGQLDSLADTEFQCALTDCSLRTECQADFSRCQRRQDARDCTTCLFRNPLNNRCMSERIDSDCEARKASLNAGFERSWEACMAREESARNRCVVRSQEATEMCESRALRNFQNCEAAQKWLLAHDGPVALVTGNAHASGSVAVGYTGLEIAGDLAGLKGLMVVEPNVDISGALNFTPFDGLGRLGDCIGDWDGPFHARLDQQQSPKRLAGALSVNDDGLMTHWPGLTVPMNMSQGPLEALLTAEPGRLSACGLGITAAEVGARATGEDGFYLRGVLPMDVQPGVTHIEMPPISLKLGERETGAIGEWGAQVLRFELQ